MRIPFPVRVFLSYLLVVVVGMLPTYIFLQAKFQQTWYRYEAVRLARLAKRIARLLSEFPPERRLVEVRHLSQAVNERVTYIDEQGRVQYDSVMSDFTQAKDHRDRKEIQKLLGKIKQREAFDPGIVGVEVAIRTSSTTKLDTMYVALRIDPYQQGRKADILRLAMPVQQVRSLLNRLDSIFRNSQAAALSIALLLSLISAIVFMRPLQRILLASKALAEGDYMHPVGGNLGNDEVGDVGRSLEKLAIHLRKRLAIAEATEVLLMQMIRAIPTPLVLFSPEHKVIGMNRSALQWFETKREDAAENLARWASSSAYQSSLALSEETGDGQRVVVPLTEDERDIQGVLYALQHPTQNSFAVFLGDQSGLQRHSHLPLVSDVGSKELAEWVTEALQDSTSALERSLIKLQQPTEWPRVLVVYAEDRPKLALLLLLEGARSRGSQDVLSLQCEVKEREVILTIKSRIPSFVQVLVRMCVEPLGGLLQMEAGECQLILPRA